MAGKAKVAKEHGSEVRIAPRGEDRDAVADRPEREPGEPLLETEAKRARGRPVEDCKSPRRSAEEDRLDQ